MFAGTKTSWARWFKPAYEDAPMKINTLALATAFGLVTSVGSYAADESPGKTSTEAPMNGKTTTGAPTGPTMMNGATTTTGNSSDASKQGGSTASSAEKKGDAATATGMTKK